MRFLIPLVLLAALTAAAQQPAGPLIPPQSALSQQSTASAANSTIVIPSGTSVVLAMVRPVWARSAKPSDAVYAETVFPVSVNNQMAIPSGTYVSGRIDALTPPRLFSAHAQFQLEFNQLVFANGYAVTLPSAPSGAERIPDDVIPAVATPNIAVTSRNDVLLDNGTQIEMVLQLPVALDAGKVADAVRQTNPGALAYFRSASMCRPIPGSPGTPDTVIPGTPGTPGTPDTVIPGAPGQPDIVIPGTPPTPGTPSMVIPGSPGTLPIPCPAPPVATTGSGNHKELETFTLDAPAQVEGKPFAAGIYEISWTGLGQTAQVQIRQNKSILATATARIVWLTGKSSTNSASTRKNSDGSLALDSLRFGGETFALYFN